MEKFSARVYRCNTAIVGSGAARYNAADRLWQLGQRDILMVTENRLGGTSRNTGSDKQTYYKLTLSGGDADSVREIADTLFSGQCVDGDIALCEAALSAQCFLKLVELGVPFPRNRYGEYIGYKTDHDPRRRATRVGPYTSRQMTEKLETAVQAKGVPMLDKTQVIRILSDGKKVLGLLCLNTAGQTEEDRFVLVRCRNVVYATGGPAGMYASSVYPLGHYGATGLALEAGVRGKNLTEWQYGLASVKPRWNVSGTYMQVLPRVFSTEADGSGEREFLMDFFSTPAEMLSKLFLKGYQWPFDIRKVSDGSSIIDILVYLESCKGEAAVGFEKAADALERMGTFANQILSETSNVHQLWRQAGEHMSRCGAAIRSGEEIRAYRIQVEKELAELPRRVQIASVRELGQAFRLRDMLISQQVYLSAMANYMEQGGQSRGSALYNVC